MTPTNDNFTDVLALAFEATIRDLFREAVSKFKITLADAGAGAICFAIKCAVADGVSKSALLEIVSDQFDKTLEDADVWKSKNLH